MTQTKALPPQSDRDRLRGHGAMLMFAVIISGSFTIGGLAAPHIDPSALTAARFALAGAAMGLGILALRPGAGGASRSIRALFAPLTRGSWRFFVLGALYGGYFIAMFEGLRHTAPAPLSAVFTLTPLMTAGFAYAVASQRTPPGVLAALVLGGVGAVWVIFDADLGALLALELGFGEQIFLIGVVAHALYTALLRKFQRDEPLLIFVFAIIIGALLTSLVFGAPAIAATDWAAAPWIVWIGIFYLGLCATLFTASLMKYAADRLPASKVMAYTYLPPSLVILIEGASGRGWPSWEIAPGVALTLIALVALALGRDA